MAYITKWRNTQKRKKEYLPLLTPEAVFCTWDVETTGTTENDKLTQFSAIKYRFDGTMFHEISYYNTYINPEQLLSAKIMKLTGITNEMLKTAPKEHIVAQNILNYLSDCDIWIGYNLGFDIEMAFRMAVRTQCFMRTKPVIDVMELARDFLSYEQVDDCKLQSVAEYLVPGSFQFHNALDDVRATTKVLESLIPYLQDYTEKTGEGYVHLEKASYWQNPYKKEARIKLVLSEGNFGDIYYNLYEHYWACKTSAAAKKLFNSINLADLENQFLEKYGYRFGRNTVDDVGFGWSAYKKEQKKAKTEACANQQLEFL